VKVSAPACALAVPNALLLTSFASLVAQMIPRPVKIRFAPMWSSELRKSFAPETRKCNTLSTPDERLTGFRIGRRS
jgi:hypothetical protein